MTSGRFGFRLAAGVALESLRLYWPTMLLIALLGAAGLGVLVPVGSLGGSGSAALLRLPPIPAGPAAVPWTAEAMAPAAIQARAVGELYLLLLILGWAALAVTGVSMLTRFFAQAAERGPEIGVRRAVGASRRNLLASLASEAGMVYLVVVALGVPLAAVLYRLSVITWPGTVAGRGLAPATALLALALIVGLGALAPLRFAGRRHMRNQAGGQVTLGIPMIQLAMSLTILLGSSALLKGANEKQGHAVAAGRTATPTRMFSITNTAPAEAARSGEIAALMERLRRAPGVQLVSAASPGTMLGLGVVDHGTTDCGMCLEGNLVIRWRLITARHNMVSEDTFRVQNLRLLEGRAFSGADDWRAGRVAIVSRHLARTAFQGGAAVGRDLYLGDDWPKRPYRVVGVVEDSRSEALGGRLTPVDAIYLHVLQHPPTELELAIQGNETEPLPLPPSARSLATGSAMLAAALVPMGWFGREFTAVGLVVLLAAIAGTFGTLRMWVRSMSGEIAARRAVGATRYRIVAWVLLETMGTGIKGALLGAFFYFSVLRVSLTNLAGSLPPWDPGVLALLAAVLLGSALLGALGPARALVRKNIAELLP